MVAGPQLGYTTRMEQQRQHIPFFRLHWLPFVVTVCALSFVLTCFLAVALLAGSALHGEPVGGSPWSWAVAAPLIGFGVALAVVLVVALPFGCLALRLRRQRRFPLWLPLVVSGPLFCVFLLWLGSILFALLGGFLMGCGCSLYWLVLSFRSHRLEVDHVA